MRQDVAERFQDCGPLNLVPNLGPCDVLDYGHWSAVIKRAVGGCNHEQGTGVDDDVYYYGGKR